MAVKFIIDSASDVLPSECKKLGAIHVPMTVRFGDKEFADAVDLSHKKFYKMLTSGKEEHPTTSQVTPAAWAEAMEEALKDADTALVITMSSKLSGTYQSACIAAEDFDGKVFVVDSMTATIGERLLLQYGLRLAADGLDAAAIKDRLDAIKDRVRIYGRLDTLEYLRKGGRIGAASAVMGTMLNIKPIISVQDGLVSNVAKARGAKMADKQLRELVTKSGGIDFPKPICAAYSGLEDDNLKTFLAESTDLLCGSDAPIASVGCVIGTHVGPGAVALAYFQN
jgi:DegV family protein with EDD domain